MLINTNAMESNENLAAGIDIGSNSIRLLIAEVIDRKIAKIIYQEKVNTRLAANIGSTGALSNEAVEKSLTTLKSYKESIDKYNISKVKAYATSAVREASNGQDFIKSAAEIGINIEVISGIEEGSVELMGVNAGFDNIAPYPFILDVGGGSTEIVFKNSKEEVEAYSYPIGVVKMADLFDFRKDTLSSILPAKKHIEKLFENMPTPAKVDNFIVTAGTSTTLAAIDQKMEEYDYKKVHGYELSIYKVDALLTTIAATPFEARSSIKGLDKGREDLIIPGAIIILSIMEKLGIKSMTVSDFGLREGATVAARYS